MSQPTDRESVCNEFSWDYEEIKAGKMAEAMGVDELGTFGDSADLSDDEEEAEN